jgi:chemotaxis signal transduction protein
MIANTATAVLSEDVAIRRFCSFRIAKQLYGVDILEIKEINSEVAFTPIFHAPPQVRGYVNIRGQIHLVVDPREPLGLPAEAACAGKMLLVFKPSVGDNCAMLVDEIGDIIDVPVSDVEEDAQAGDDDGALTTGVCKLNGQLLVALRPRGFFRFTP